MTVYSCSLIPKQVDVISKPLDRRIAQPMLPRGIDLKEPYWYVVSEKNIDEFLDRLKKEEGRIVSKISKLEMPRSNYLMKYTRLRWNEFECRINYQVI